jgi:parvulin-like peptidyl-prolyl isomerase
MARNHRIPITFLCALALLGCTKDDKKKDKDQDTDTDTEEAAAPAGGDGIESTDILARAQTEKKTEVKHVLIGWKELEPAYRGHMDPRAGARTQEEAGKLALEIKGKMNPDTIDALIQKHSEDPGSVEGMVYTVTPNARLVPPFKKLGLRLKMNEVGVVKTEFGYHVMMRVAGKPTAQLPPREPPPPSPPDPLESADILARPEQPGTMWVLHVLVSWKDAPASKVRPPDPRAAERTKEDADKLALEILDKVRKGGDMKALMKQYSEDPGSKDTGRAYEVTAAARLIPPFKALSLRLQMGETGLVKTDFGWHVIKRVPEPPPPPPDPLDSVAILKRTPVTEKATVKHILLGWVDAHAPGSAGEKRTRAELDALVKKTLARVKKGENFEALMKELSEDGGSAQSGQAYPVTPDAGLVPPFKTLSLRLNVNEVGAVKTQFGIHIIKRIE